jgi:hypothetical protein
MDGPNLELRLEPSRRLLRAQLLLHAAALAAPFGTALPTPARLLLVVLVTLSVVRQIGAFAAWRRRGPLCLYCRDGAWTLGPPGVAVAVAPLGDSTVWPWLVVLRLRTPRGRRALVLLEDSLPGCGLRPLRAALRVARMRFKA